VAVHGVGAHEHSGADGSATGRHCVHAERSRDSTVRVANAPTAARPGDVRRAVAATVFRGGTRAPARAAPDDGTRAAACASSGDGNTAAARRRTAISSPFDAADRVGHELEPS
jgi:hypothetical protein